MSGREHNPKNWPYDLIDFHLSYYATLQPTLQLIPYQPTYLANGGVEGDYYYFFCVIEIEKRDQLKKRVQGNDCHKSRQIMELCDTVWPARVE